MIAAIYARKSTEQNIADEEKSVTRQVEHAKAYAVKKGWSVAEEHVYADDGISGAEFVKRPGFLQLMNALKPRPPFQALVMSEESRLGREQIETSYALKQLITAGVRVFYYLEDRERILESPTDKLLLSVSAYADEVERDKARQRTYDALVRKARAGHVAGGRVYGYDNEPVTSPDGTRLHVKRAINDDEARVVRRIFERYAAGGAGYRRIAHELNAAGLVAPRPRPAGRPRGWCSSTVRAVLYQDLYRGVLIWGRGKKRDAWGRRQTRRRESFRAPDDCVRREAPELRIVSDELWQAAHERLQRSRHVYGRAMAGRLQGKPANGIESRYLLTGFAVCAWCGGALTIRSSSRGRRRAYFVYQCLTHVQRGRAVCANSTAMPMEAADREVLDTVESTLLRADVVAAAIEDAASRLQPDLAQQATERPRLQKELGRVEAEIGNLVKAIAEGAEFPSIKGALRDHEQQRERLQQELAALDRLAQVGQLDGARLRRTLAAKLGDWRGLLRRQVQQARQILTTLLDGRLRFTPQEDGWWAFEGAGRVEPVLEGLVNPLPKALVTPAGFEPAISTLKGSRPWPG